MYCTHCGNQIDDNAVVCIHCGVSVKQKQEQEQHQKVNVCGIIGFIAGIITYVFGFFIMLSPALLIIPTVGLILSIIGTAMRKSYNSCNGLAVAGLVLSILAVAVWFLFVFIVSRFIVVI